ncbi:MAG TPA: hypothetical protein VK842_04615 [bacterium]|jgi:hypothetical protein|nr:hypothetical protein [bacterium]
MNFRWLAFLALLAAPLAAHEHHPPHQGSLQVLGDDFAHLEMVLDAKEGLLTAYALDGEAEEPVRLAQKELRIRVTLSPSGRTVDLALKAVANELSGETVGNTSQFEAHAKVLLGQTGFSGRLAQVDVRGAIFKQVRLAHPQGNEAGEKP